MLIGQGCHLLVSPRQTSIYVICDVPYGKLFGKMFLFGIVRGCHLLRQVDSRTLEEEKLVAFLLHQFLRFHKSET